MICAMELGLVQPPQPPTTTTTTTTSSVKNSTARKEKLGWPETLTTELESVQKSNDSAIAESRFADGRIIDTRTSCNNRRLTTNPEEHHRDNHPSFVEHRYSLPPVSPKNNSRPTKRLNIHYAQENHFFPNKNTVYNPFHHRQNFHDGNRERITEPNENRTTNVLRENNREARKSNFGEKILFEKSFTSTSCFGVPKRRYFSGEREDSTRLRVNARAKISVGTGRDEKIGKTIVPVARVRPQTSVFKDFGKTSIRDSNGSLENKIRKIETHFSSSDVSSSNEAPSFQNFRKKRFVDDKKNWKKNYTETENNPNKVKKSSKKFSDERRYYRKPIWWLKNDDKNECEKENFTMTKKNVDEKTIENRKSAKKFSRNVKNNEKKTIRSRKKGTTIGVENSSLNYDDSDVDESLLVNPSTDLPNALLEMNDHNDDETVDLNPSFDVDFEMNFQARETSTILDVLINGQVVPETDDDDDDPAVSVDVATENPFDRPNPDDEKKKLPPKNNEKKTSNSIVKSKKRRSADSVVASNRRRNESPNDGCNDKNGNDVDEKNVRVTRGSMKNILGKTIVGASSKSGWERGTIVWGNCTGWWPGLIIDAEEVGMSSSDGKSWIYWIGEHRISHLRDKTQIQSFSYSLRTRMVEIFRVKNFKDVNYSACLSTIKLVNDQILQRGPLTKPYHAWVEKHLMTHENVDRLILQPYPSNVQKRLDELRIKNLRATEKYLAEIDAVNLEKKSKTRTANANASTKTSIGIADPGHLPLASQKPGVITWAKIMGQMWWPAMIIDFRDCGMKEPNFGCQWILWYGDYTLSQVNHRFFLAFDKGMGRMKNHAKNSKREVYRRGVVEAAKDYCSRYGYKTESWTIDDVLNWFSKLDCEDDEDDDDDDDDDGSIRDLRGTALPGIPASPETPEKYPPRIVEGLRKHKGNCTVAAIREHNIKDSDALKLVIAGKLSVKNLCLMCLNDFDDDDEKSTIDHPFFEGRLCVDCSEKYTPTIFAYGDDGKCFFCAVCAGSDTVVICDEPDCPRVYCTACLKYLIAPNTYDDIMMNDPFVCFVCENSTYSSVDGLLKPRKDWKIRVKRLFGGNRDSVPNRVEHYKNGKKKLRVLSLFDGISAGLVVLNKLGIHVEVYYASEIDNDAEMVSSAHFGDRIIRLGDVRTINDEKIREIAPIHLLIGGSPCNDLSLVNPVRRGLHDPNGTGVLVFEYRRIKNLIERFNGDEEFFWLFENVASMPSKYRIEINEQLGRQPDLIDAANYSPQHRPRLYWNNFPTVSYPLSSQDLQDVLTPNCNRHALVKKIRTVTTRTNSLKQGKESLKPILMNEQNDSLWITELEEIFGFPRHYTDVKNLCATKRQKLIGKSWSVQTITELMRPLCNFFQPRERQSL